MNNKQQTAVEWLVEQLKDMEYDLRLIPNTIEKAKEMEKQQITDTFVEGMRCQNFDPNKGRAEIYYNETFNK